MIVDRIWTPLSVLEWTTERFSRAGLDSPRLDAQVLLAHALGCDRVSLYMRFDEPLMERELAAFRALVQGRLAGQPVAYLVGRREFWSQTFRVDARVLIPRPDTETLVQVALDALRAAPSAEILEVGTGSGAIAISLARELASARLVAIDASPGALEVAADNARELGVIDRIDLRAGDLLAPLAAGETFDAVVANLPYIPTGDLAGLSREVRAEPRAALDGGTDGLDLIRRLVAGVRARLRPGGLIALEHGGQQATAVRDLLRDAGCEAVASHRDLAGLDRVTTGRA